MEDLKYYPWFFDFFGHNTICIQYFITNFSVPVYHKTYRFPLRGKNFYLHNSINIKGYPNSKIRYFYFTSNNAHYLLLLAISGFSEPTFIYRYFYLSLFNLSENMFIENIQGGDKNFDRDYSNPDDYITNQLSETMSTFYCWRGSNQVDKIEEAKLYRCDTLENWVYYI